MSLILMKVNWVSIPMKYYQYHQYYQKRLSFWENKQFHA